MEKKQDKVMDLEIRRTREELRRNPHTRMLKLVEAIKNGEITKVSLLIGLDTALNKLINAEDVYGQPPIHNAARFNQAETAVALIELGALVDFRNRAGNTPLHVACQFGSTETASTLIHFGAFIQAKGMSKMTALHFASTEGQVDCVKLLLQKGASCFARTSTEVDWGNTSLHSAAWHGKANCAEAVLDHCANRGILTDMIEARNRLHNTPLHLAAQNGHGDVVKVLLTRGANVHALGKHGRKPIHMAAIYGKADVARILLENGAQIKSCSGPGAPEFRQTPIHLAAANGQVSVIDVLLEYDKQLINMPSHLQGQQPLHRAVDKFQSDCVAHLLLRGAIIDATDDYGRTPLSMATNSRSVIGSYKKARNRDKIVNILVENEGVLK